MPLSPALTRNELNRRILRWNLVQLVSGGAVLCCAAVAWGLTFYFVAVFVAIIRTLPTPVVDGTAPWSELNVFERSLSTLVLTFIGGVGFFGRSTLFLPYRPDERFAAVEPTEWRPNFSFDETLPLTLLFSAPALTSFGLRMIFRCFSLERRRIDLACRTYVYLNQWNGWFPYPKLLSQRRAVNLLYQLGLVQVSNRFGKLEIRIQRRQP